jgi:hypothetical protein
MFKNTFLVSALSLAGVLLGSRAAESSTLQYGGQFCDSMFNGSGNFSKSPAFTTSSNWMDLVCPIATTSTKSFTISRIRVRTAYTNPGGSCTLYTRTAYGSQVAAITKSLPTTPTTDATLNFGTVSFANAAYSYITCYVPPGTTIHNYFVNQPD